MRAAPAVPPDAASPSSKGGTTTILRSMPLHGDEVFGLLRRVVESEETLRRRGRRPPPLPASSSSSSSSSLLFSSSPLTAIDRAADRNDQVPHDFDENDVDDGNAGRRPASDNQDAYNEDASRTTSDDDDDDEDDDDDSDESHSDDGRGTESSESGATDDGDGDDDELDPGAPRLAGIRDVGPTRTRIAGVEAHPSPTLGSTALPATDASVAGTVAPHQNRRRGGGGKGRAKERRAKDEAEYRRHLEQIPCRHFELMATPGDGGADSNEGMGGAEHNPGVALCVPTCLWPDRDARDDIDQLLSRRYVENKETSDAKAAKALLSILPSPSSSPTPSQQVPSATSSPSGLRVVIWWMRSGRFAGGVFVNERCVEHSTKARYTVRKGQGKSQGAMDNQKGKNAKSVGAQLRRAGQVQLWEDVRVVAKAWASHLRSAHLVLIMVPPVMHAQLWKDTFDGLLSKDDDRVRTRVSLNVKKPGYDALVRVHRVVTTCTIRRQQPPRAGSDASTIIEPKNSGPVAANVPERSDTSQRGAPGPTMDWPSFTALHEAAAKGRVEALVTLLGQNDVNVDAVAGPLLQTPLHVAASAGAAPMLDDNADGNDERVAIKAMEALSTEDASLLTPNDAISAAAECVYQLLVTGRADPAVLDVRGRPPYYLASHDNVRIAFRRARAALEADRVEWDWAASKIGPALTDHELEAKKEREAEKKRQKKQRQKERKAKDKADAEAAERQRQQQIEEQRKQEEAKRIRDGLQPKSNGNATNACDYCQKVCVGKRRRDMYQRLEYAYCSAACVQLHKRELMAGAALARFQSPS